MFGMHRGVCALALVSVVAAPATVLGAPTNPGELINDLAPSTDCNYCHAFSNQDTLFTESPYAPQTTWTPTLMANAARDPVFWAGVAIAAQDDAEHTDDCIRCHSPNAFLNGRGGATSIEELEPDDGDLEGVTCEFCHRMTEGSLLGNAQYELDDVLQGATVARRGPWDYSDGVPAPIPGAEGHVTTFDPFTGSSEMCGTCHEVTTHRERVDSRGNGMGADFNEQRTYSEWARSDFAEAGEGFRSCQDCHMPEVPDSAACGPYNNVHEHPLGNRRHDLLGANRFMLTMLAEEALPGFEAATYELALDKIDEFVRTSASMEVTPPASVDLGAGLQDFVVRVTNDTGHKLPSGYSEGRVMWIEVVASYNDEVVISSGRWDQSTGSIQEDPSVRRYEGVAEDLESGTRNHLLLNNHWVIDNRIPPRGLQPHPETDPVSERYGMTPQGSWEHWDEVNYALPGAPEVEDATPGDAGDDELHVSVRLLYVINTREYIELLADDNETSEVGTELAGRFEAMGWATPVVLAEEELTVQISSFGEVEAGTSTGEGADETTATSDPTNGSDPSSPTDPVDPDSSGGASDTEPAAGGGGGGGCRVGGDSAPWGWSLFLLGGFVRRRRDAGCSRESAAT
ncbi:MAG: cytochrome c family protein [Nannocystaceae bacterium]|nr:cytochrome c family protein [Nannocystaceae bacterium]